jgi:hypothetical protein
VLFDTDVLVWALRGDLRAARTIDRDRDRRISAVTYMELLQGARDRAEVKSVKAFVAERGFGMIPLTENIGDRATVYIEEYGPGGGVRLADALIAATAVESQLVLCSGDTKHYALIKELHVERFRVREP